MAHQLWPVRVPRQTRIIDNTDNVYTADGGTPTAARQQRIMIITIFRRSHDSGCREGWADEC